MIRVWQSWYLRVGTIYTRFETFLSNLGQDCPAELFAEIVHFVEVQSISTANQSSFWQSAGQCVGGVCRRDEMPRGYFPSGDRSGSRTIVTPASAMARRYCSFSIRKLSTYANYEVKKLIKISNRFLYEFRKLPEKIEKWNFTFGYKKQNGE